MTKDYEKRALKIETKRVGQFKPPCESLLKDGFPLIIISLMALLQKVITDIVSFFFFLFFMNSHKG